MRWIILAMLLLVAGFVALAYVPADMVIPISNPDPTYTQGSYSLRLTDRPCPFEEFTLELEEVGIPPARAFVASQEGRPTTTGCYSLDLEGDVLTRDLQAGDGFIPRDWFR